MADASDRPPAHAARDEYAVGYDGAALRLFQERTLATCAPFLLPHLRPGLAVLDCGCGPGSMTIELAERVAPGQVVGIDLEAGQFEQARAWAAERKVGNVRFEPGDVYALPFPDASFDLVFSHGLVSHLADPARAFAEGRRVLRPGGLLAAAENDTGTWAISPAASPQERAGGLTRRVMAHAGRDQLLTRHLRGALLTAGFARAEGYAGAEVWGTPERVRLLAAASAAIVRGPAVARTALEQGWASQAELDELAAAVTAWGERPDAYAAVLKCGALGWKPLE